MPLKKLKKTATSNSKRSSAPLAKAPVRRKGFMMNVRSRHPSHSPLKKDGTRLPFRSVVRLGSDWPGDGKNRIEINSVAAVRTSANKLLMKTAFTNNGVITADWWKHNNTTGNIVKVIGAGNPVVVINEDLPFPVVAKHIYGSRGTGNYLLKTQAEFNTWRQGKTIESYIFEKFYDYTREYRLHVTKDGCFYTCRKMLKESTPEHLRWFRNDSNCVWVKELDDNGNPKADFDKPINWNAIVAESVKALKAVGLDIGAIDVKVQSAKKKDGTPRQDVKFIILETNSAPSFGEVTLAKYRAEVPRLLKDKAKAHVN